MEDRSPLLHKNVYALILVLCGCIGSLLYHFLNQQGYEPVQGPYWEVQFEVYFEDLEKGAEITVPAPTIGSTFYQMGNRMEYPGFLLKKASDSTSSNRYLFSARDDDFKMIALSWELEQFMKSIKLKSKKPSVEKLKSYLKDSEEFPIEDPNIKKVLESLSDPSLNSTAQNIFAYCRKIQLDEGGPEDVAGVVQAQNGSLYGISKTFATLCRAAGIAARINNGIELQESNMVPWHIWTEIFLQDSWVYCDVSAGTMGQLPLNLLPFGDPQYRLALEMYSGEWRVTSKRVKIPKNMREYSEILKLNKLPLETQKFLGLLLLMPLAVLITRLLIVLLSVKSFGTFTPTLLASTFVFADLWTSSLIFLSVFTLGTLGCVMLPDKTPRSLRLSFIFAFVTIILAYVVSGLDFFNQPLDGLALLPLVVMTTICDSFYSAFDKKGKRVAVLRLFWTLVFSMVCGMVLMMEDIGDWILNHPPIHLVSLGVIVAISSVNFKLLEKTGLKLLIEPFKKKSNPEEDASL